MGIPNSGIPCIILFRNSSNKSLILSEAEPTLFSIPAIVEFIALIPLRTAPEIKS